MRRVGVGIIIVGIINVGIIIAIELVACTESEFELTPRTRSSGNPKAGSYF